MGTETRFKVADISVFTVTTHTPYGDGNVLVLVMVIPFSRSQLIPPMGTETFSVKLTYISFMSQLIPPMGTETSETIPRQYVRSVTTHTPYGDGNNFRMCVTSFK